MKRHHTPVFSEIDYSPAQIALRFTMYLGGTEGFAEAYMSMMPNIRQFLPPILNHIVHKRTPFIVHCTAGKDRTGVVCALLQMICGVDEEQIAWEYELTRRCMASKSYASIFLHLFVIVLVEIYDDTDHNMGNNQSHIVSAVKEEDITFLKSALGEASDAKVRSVLSTK